MRNKLKNPNLRYYAYVGENLLKLRIRGYFPSKCLQKLSRMVLICEYLLILSFSIQVFLPTLYS